MEIKFHTAYFNNLISGLAIRYHLTCIVKFNERDTSSGTSIRINKITRICAYKAIPAVEINQIVFSSENIVPLCNNN